MNLFAGDDAGAIDFVEALQAAGEIDRISKNGVVQPCRGTDVSNPDRTGVQPDSGSQGGEISLPPVGSQFLKVMLGLQGCMAGFGGHPAPIDLSDPEGHDGVADELVEDPGLPMNLLTHSFEIFTAQLNQLIGIE